MMFILLYQHLAFIVPTSRLLHQIVVLDPKGNCIHDDWHYEHHNE